eukprot:TRINITY_DN20197_c0_g1_i2.p1 TRINITY_DN20197_c0_g1~~TRINITY_DN20197_c0_g1_i2.p1  ORF type:complete len:211 (-),score=52.19 TRINITY_DN20197_c0_g1_i2:203-835(-)
MLRSLVGSEMCIRDRYQRRVRGESRWGMRGECYYALLGLDKTCSPDEIKAAYHKCALVNHPDRLLGRVTEHELAAANKKFAAITQAHATLSNKVNRRIYDMNGPSEGLRTWRTSSTEIPFRKRLVKSWGPIIALQAAILGTILLIKNNAEDTKVPMHGTRSSYMSNHVHTNTSSDIGSAVNEFRAEQGRSKVQTIDSPEPFRQPRSGGLK